MQNAQKVLSAIGKGLLRGINFGFWSHSGCSEKNAIIFSREGLVQGCTRKIYIVCVLTWSLLGIKNSLGPAQIGLLQGFNSKFPTSIPTPFICCVSPSPQGAFRSRLLWLTRQTPNLRTSRVHSLRLPSVNKKQPFALNEELKTPSCFLLVFKHWGIFRTRVATLTMIMLLFLFEEDLSLTEMALSWLRATRYLAD